jgi:hypothetical protein
MPIAIDALLPKREDGLEASGEIESAPRETRTPNRLFRRQVLCPIELWVQLQLGRNYSLCCSTRERMIRKEEVMAPDWKNPMLKVKPPKVVLDPLEPISIQDVRALINTCQRGDFIGERDRALFPFLLRRMWARPKLHNILHLHMSGIILNHHVSLHDH